DVNGDGKFNSKDIALMKRIIAGTAAAGTYNEANADITGDGKFTNKDLSALKKIVAQGG
ncbi:MAG: dockerin type I repeat-containing protein, partial [Clostridia bacterium]|nr:dockerin type I repeat-containing protein [Clostridia bacterium]